MPVFEYNNKKYNVPDNDIKGFAERKPDAVASYEFGGKKYRVPASDIGGFLSRKKGAVQVDHIVSNKIEKDSGAAIGNIQGAINNVEAGFWNDQVGSVLKKVGVEDTSFPAQTELPNVDKSGLQKQYDDLLHENKQVVDSYEAAQGLKALKSGHALGGSTPVEVPFLLKLFAGDQEKGQKNEEFLESSKSKYVDVKKRQSYLQHAIDLAKLSEDNTDFNPKDSNWRNLWKGMTESGLLKDWATFGLTEMNRLKDIRRVAEKREGGEKLNSEEESLLQTYGALLEIQQGKPIESISYGIGQGVKEMVPFLAEFAATGGVTSGLRAGLKGALKVGAEGAKKQFVRKLGAHAIESVPRSMLAQSRIGADYQQRRLDNYGIDHDGGVKVSDDPTSAVGDYYRAAASNWTEFFSEDLGGLVKIGRTGVGVVDDAVGAIGKRFNRAKSTKVWKWGAQGMEKVGWNGVIGEYIEENVGNVMQAALTGDTSLFDSFNKEDQLVLAGSVLAMGGAMRGLQLAGSGVERSVDWMNQERSYSKADKGLSVVGDENADVVRNAVGRSKSIEDAVGVICDVSKGLDEKQRQALLSYTIAGFARKGRLSVVEKELTEKTGGFVNNQTDGVQIVTDLDGNMFFVTGESLDGDKKVYAVSDGNGNVSVKPAKEMTDAMLSSKEDFINEYVLRSAVENQKNYLGQEQEGVIVPDNVINDGSGVTESLGQMLYDGNLVQILEDKVQSDGTVLVKYSAGGEPMRVVAKELVALDGGIEPESGVGDAGGMALLKDGRQCVLARSEQGLLAYFDDGSCEVVSDDMVSQRFNNEGISADTEQSDIIPAQDQQKVVLQDQQIAVPAQEEQSNAPVSYEIEKDVVATQQSDGVFSVNKEFTKSDLEKGEKFVERMNKDYEDEGMTFELAEIPKIDPNNRFEKRRFGVVAREKVKEVEKMQEAEVLRSVAEQHEAEALDVNVSQELDYKGNPFVLSSNGTADFGVISKEQADAIGTGVEAPVRLSRGNEGYGKIHIDERLAQLKQNGYNSTENFVVDVVNNYDEIRSGNLYTDKDGETKETFLLVKRGDKGSVLYVELAPDGGYYDVNSGGVFKNSYIEKRDLLWNASTEHSAISGESQGFPLAQLNPESDNVSALPQSESLSTNKDTEVSGENKEVEEIDVKDVPTLEEQSEIEAAVSDVKEDEYGDDGEIRYREVESSEDVNERFNEEIDHFTKDNALSTIFDLGNPSECLLSAGIANKPIRLYGSKVLKKMKKHGFKIEELRDLPNAVAHPIAVFDNVGRNGNRSVLTDLKTVNGNFLVTIDLGKGTDVDFDVVSSVFGKSDNSVLSWINKGLATYINKEKALGYLRISAPIAEASNSQELSSATNIVQNFENPTLEEGEISSIIDVAQKAGAYLKAPNGKDTNLTPKQWVQVRTKAFKDWFGDWELDPKNASKVVDGNGEPMVVYHGSPKTFTAFSEKYMGSNGTAIGQGFYFTNEKSFADGYSSDGGHVFEVFLNLRKGLNADKVTIKRGQLKKILKGVDSVLSDDVEHAFLSNYNDVEYNGLERTLNEAVEMEMDAAESDVDLVGGLVNGSGSLRDVYDVLERTTGHDGVIGNQTDGSVHFVVGSPSQIKSATGNVGTFSKGSDDIRYREQNDEAINDRFNRELQQQIDGKLPKGHVYQLGNPSGVLRSAGIPDLPIEMAASRLSDKSAQENHPFGLGEIKGLPNSIHSPLAVFRSATHLGSFVVMTEIEHKGKNFVVAIEANRQRGRIEVNSIRSIHYRTSNTHMANWIEEGLLEYADKKRMSEWLSKQRYNSADVKQLFGRVTKVLQSFENPSVEAGEISSTIDNLSDELGVKINKVRDRKDLPDGIQRRMKSGRYPGLYDPKSGKVYVVMNEITDVEDAQATVLHEVLGHKGVHGLFGEKLGEFTDRVLKSMPEYARAKLIEKHGGNEQLSAEEYVAGFAEGYADPTAWEKVKAIVKELLRELGIDLKLSDNDLKYVLWKAKNGLRDGDTMIDVARKVSGDRGVQNSLFREDNGVSSERNVSIEEVNARFNEELQQQIDGKLPKGHVYELGKPSGVLRSAGIPDLPIELAASTLEIKSGVNYQNKHPFELIDVVGLPSAVHDPVAVFDSKTRPDSKVILTELQHGDVNFVVAMQVDYKKQGSKIVVNSVRSLYPKDQVSDILNWVNDGLLKWTDKKKTSDFLNKLPSQFVQKLYGKSDVLSSATNIVQNFENPKGNVEEGVLFREAHQDLVESEVKQEKIIKPSLTQTDIIADLQSQMLNDRVNSKLIAGRLSIYVRGVFGKDLVEAMGKEQFDAIVKEIEQATLDIKMPEESRPLVDERKELILQFYKEIGNKEATAQIGSRIKEIDRNLNDMAKEVLRKPMYRIADVVTDIELKRQTERLDKLVHLKVAGENRHGVSVAKTVDEETKVALHYIRDHVGQDMTQEIAELKKKQSESNNAEGSVWNEDSVKLKSAMALQQFFATDNSHELIEDYKKRVEEVRIDINKIEGEIEAEKWKEEPDKKYLASLRKKVRNKKQEVKYSAFAIIDDRHRLSRKMIKLNDLIEDLVYEGKSSFFDWVNEESTRRAEVVREAMRDMDTRRKQKVVLDDKEGFAKKTMRFIKKHLLSSAWSFDYLVKHLSQNAMNGEGEFYDRIMKGRDGLTEASSNFWKGRLDFINEVEAKSEAIFGKRYEAAMIDSNKELEGVVLTVNDGGITDEDIRPTIGQALYVVMLNKMTDGAAKLRQKGITDEDVRKLKGSIPESYLKWADWVQEEFLPEKREKYNDTHVRIFGSSMAKIDHYFPLRVQKQNVYKEVDMSRLETDGLPSGITGSIINRKPNSILPAFNTNALELLLDHGREMEHWNAYTRVVHDLNGLLSSTSFRNMLEEKERGLFNRFRAVSTIAVEAYCPKDDDLNKFVVAVSKGYTGAKINFRLNTALKQVLSSPAFYSYAFDGKFALKLTRNVSPDVWRKNWEWGMENLPLFEKRWRERNMGNEKLGDDGVKWIDGIMGSKFMKAGMWPNAFVDAITCVNGAKAVYDYKVESYREVGVSEEEAQRRAKIDAVLSFNQTQQSNEGFMLAEMQKKRDLWNAGLSVFNNSTFLYLRQTMEGAKELTRNIDQEVSSRKRVLMKMGVAEERAEIFAKRDVYRMKRTAIAKIGVMGVGMQVIWGLGSGAWNYLWALFTDDDDAKEVVNEMKGVLLKSALIGPIRGTSYGGQLESFIDGYESNVIGLPMFDDFKDFFKLFRKGVDDGVFNPVIAYEAFRLFGEGVSGLDLNTVANAYIGIEDAIRSGDVRAENIGYFLNAPKSQVRLLAERRRGDEGLMDYIARIGRLNMEVRLRNNGELSDKRMKDLKDKYRLSPYERVRRKEIGHTKSALGKVNDDRGLSVEEKRLKRDGLREKRDERINELKEMYDVKD